MTPTDSKKKTKGTGSVRTSGATPKVGSGRICPECRTENSGNSRFCSNCASPLQDTHPPAGGGDGAKTVRASTVELARGNRLAGRYEIIEELGRGGMGKVFKAYDHKISEVIALKLIRPEISAQDKAIERFKNELKFTRKITHRNICRMYDLGEEDYIYYITMEYVAGEDLKRFVKRAGPLNAGKAIMIAGQICDGLAEAHRIGAIHRDLKPQNIMIDSDGNAKIMDFGIARFTDMDRMTGSGVMIGTPEYMSPEQAELTEVDARSDIYSLGVVLFEMVTGKVPFEGATPLSLAMKHKMEIPKNVREWNAQVPLGLAAVIAKCLEKDPGKRYQTAVELKTALEGAGRDVATAEWKVPQKAAPPKEKAAAGKRKNFVPLIAAAALTVVAVVAYFLFFKSGTPSAAPEETTVEAGLAATPPDAGLKAKSEEALPSAVSGKKPEAVPPKTSGAETPSAKIIQGSKKPEAGPDMTREERQAVDLAHARLIGARSVAAKEGLGQNSAFFVAAEMLQENGQGAVRNKKGADARCYFTIAEKLLRLCVSENSDPSRWKALLNLVDDLREDALKAWKGVPADPLFQDAQNRVSRGDVARAKNDLGNAVKEYAVAAFDYEKIWWMVTSALNK